MTLKEIREDYVRYSTIVSELSRNLSYVGIGIVWIFKQTNTVNIPKATFMNSIPLELRMPLILFIAVLIVDLFQYVIQTLIWYPYYVRQKKKHPNENEDTIDLNEPESYSVIPWMFWIFKLLMVIAAYFQMGLFLLR
jgi:hypothetical protein